MNFQRKNIIKNFGKRCLLASFLLINLQALRCGKKQQLVIGKTVIGYKDVATRLISLDESDFDSNIENIKDISCIEGDIVHVAVREGNQHKMQTVLERIKKDLEDQKPSDAYKSEQNEGFPNALNQKGYTPFMQAVRKKNKKIVEEMLNYPSFIDMSTPSAKTGNTPLHICAKHKYRIPLEITRELVAKLPCNECFIKNKKGRDPLFLAARRKNFEAFRCLFQKVVEHYKGDRGLCSEFLKKKLLRRDCKSITPIFRSVLLSDHITRGLAVKRRGVRMLNNVLALVVDYLSPQDLNIIIKTIDADACVFRPYRMSSKEYDKIITVLDKYRTNITFHTGHAMANKYNGDYQKDMY